MLFALAVLCPLAAAQLVRRHSLEETTATVVVADQAEFGKPFTAKDHLMVLETFMNGKVEIPKGTFGVVLKCCARNGAAKILFDTPAVKDQALMVKPQNFKHLGKTGHVRTPTEAERDDLEAMMDPFGTKARMGLVPKTDAGERPAPSGARQADPAAYDADSHSGRKPASPATYDADSHSGRKSPTTRGFDHDEGRTAPADFDHDEGRLADFAPGFIGQNGFDHDEGRTAPEGFDHDEGKLADFAPGFIGQNGFDHDEGRTAIGKAASGTMKKGRLTAQEKKKLNSRAAGAFGDLEDTIDNYDNW